MKPNDIKQQVWDAAVKLASDYAEWLRAGNSTGILSRHAEEAMADTIARAIMAEREACAVILDERAQDFNRQRDPGMANSCRSHARAIRNRP